MKWLLITTLGKNVGDEFARIGVQNLIREIDPQAQFELLCKETPGIYQPRDFDRAVLCGMPLFWSIQHNECQDIGWWNPIIRGWVSKEKRKFAVIGAGHVFVGEIFNFPRYCEAIAEVVRRAHVVTVREPVMDHPGIVDSVCPAAFAITQHAGFASRLCNLMAHGSHHYCLRTQEEDLKAWHRILPELSAYLISQKFFFVAHNQDEKNLAASLGWKPSFILLHNTPEEYLETYRKAGLYFGNRLHGAVVSASIGAKVFAVAADSRIKMVERVGGKVCRPRDLTLEDLVGFVNSKGPINWEVERLRWYRVQLKMLLREFAN